MPYPNEHACRLKSPGAFQPGSFRRIRSGGASIIIGRPKGQSTTTAQAIRYPKSSWTAERAAEHCKKHGGSFEAASSAQAFTSDELRDLYAKPENNPLLEDDSTHDASISSQFSDLE